MTRLDARFMKHFFVQETPSGTVNGINTVFNLSSIPLESDAVLLFAAGLLLDSSSAFSVSGTTITFAVAPLTATVVRAFYIRKTGE